MKPYYTLDEAVVYLRQENDPKKGFTSLDLLHWVREGVLRPCFSYYGTIRIVGKLKGTHNESHEQIENCIGYLIPTWYQLTKMFDCHFSGRDSVMSLVGTFSFIEDSLNVINDITGMIERKIAPKLKKYENPQLVINLNDYKDSALSNKRISDLFINHDELDKLRDEHIPNAKSNRSSSNSRQIPEVSNTSIEESNLLIIGAMLAGIKYEKEGRQASTVGFQTALIDNMVEVCGTVTGISKSNLDKRFTAANKLLKQKKSDI